MIVGVTLYQRDEINYVNNSSDLHCRPRCNNNVELTVREFPVVLRTASGSLLLVLFMILSFAVCFVSRSQLVCEAALIGYGVFGG